MIAFIEGKVLRVAENSAIIKTAGGVGYLLFCSSQTLSQLKQRLEQEVFLAVEMQMREDGIKLFGFLEEQEQSMFRHLVKVQGVSGALAMAIFSTLSPQKLATSLANEDSVALTAVGGIGPKLAKRITTELTALATKGKFGIAQELPADTKHKNALAALMSLGYGRSEAIAALSKVEGETLEELIQNALRTNG